MQMCLENDHAIVLSRSKFSNIGPIVVSSWYNDSMV